MIVDGWIIPQDWSLTFAQGRQQPVDVLVGSNKDEGSPELASASASARALAERVSSYDMLYAKILAGLKE